MNKGRNWDRKKRENIEWNKSVLTGVSKQTETEGREDEQCGILAHCSSAYFDANVGCRHT